MDIVSAAYPDEDPPLEVDLRRDLTRLEASQAYIIRAHTKVTSYIRVLIPVPIGGQHMLPQPSFTGTSSLENALQRPESATSAGTQAYRDEAPNAATTSRKRTPQTTSSSSDKKRKTTYEIRREEKMGLAGQVENLQKQLDNLKYRVLVEQGEAAKSNERTAVENSVLHDFIQKQHLELAKMQAMLASHSQQSMDTLRPAQSIIRLGSDPTERRNVLVALKDKKLREAKRFITARSHGLDPRSSYSQEERNNKPGQDFCHVIFENRAIHGASARGVFEAFIDVAQNAEIEISELFGSITIREDTEVDTRDVSQMRLVTLTSLGTVVESNTVMFAEFVEGKDESCGVIVADFVDSDELYPYKPEERARRDSTTVFMIRSFKQDTARKTSDDIKTTTDEDERIVVVARWTCSKIQRSKMNISADALRELQESTTAFGDTMKKCIQQRLGKTGIFGQNEKLHHTSDR